MSHRRFWPPILWAMALALVAACAAPTQAPPSAAQASSRGAAPAAAGAPSPAAAASGKPELVTTPLVDLKVGTIPISAWSPFFIAQGRGYFREVGLNVELVSSGSSTEQMVPLALGQLHVAMCPNGLVCYNALDRGTELKFVADFQKVGKTAKSSPNLALVQRKGLPETSAIRQPRDLVGRTVHVQGGETGLPALFVSRWLMRHGVDPREVNWVTLPIADLLTAMGNGAADVGVSSEPLLSAGLTRGIHEIVATDAEMHPEAETGVVAYWSGIDTLGPMVGERFMVAWLRAVRAYINAFEYGVDQDEIIDILTRETTIKDPAVFRQIKYSGVDPNGVMAPDALAADVRLFAERGVLPNPPDIRQAIDDRYRQFAVQYLGEYQPPQ